ncbi:MAG: hypothetical protein M3326_16585, partial [Actinomycetota bacterium]|nr:hypothetical protein [Actinomycetota bacterium]
RMLTGQAPGGSVELVTFQKAPQTKGYRCTLVPKGTASGEVVGDTGEVTALDMSVGDATGPALAGAATTPMPGAGTGTAGLTPPLAAMAGYSSYTSPVSWTAGPPYMNGKPDDKTVGTTSQPNSSTFLTEFFVYWVNGVQSSPYYVVILRQSGPMSLGSMVANVENSRGYFQYELGISPNTVVQSNSQPVTSGIQLAAYSPNASSGPEVPVSISVPMTLNADTQNGTGPVQFTAQVDDSLDYTGWAIRDLTSGGQTSWQAYQSATWNPVQDPVSDFSNWYKTVYDGHGKVIAPPNLSQGAVPFELLTAWQFTPPLFTAPASAPFNPPPSCVLTFGCGWSQTVALLHNPDGCNSGHHHIFNGGFGWGGAWTMDLGSVAGQQNIP